VDFEKENSLVGVRHGNSMMESNLGYVDGFVGKVLSTITGAQNWLIVSEIIQQPKLPNLN